MSYFSHCCDQVLQKQLKREENFILSHGFRGSSPSWREGIVGQSVHNMAAMKEKKGRERGQGQISPRAHFQ
jgi:hypothetical protein